jgi:hypothetical protein
VTALPRNQSRFDGFGAYQSRVGLVVQPWESDAFLF